MNSYTLQQKHYDYMLISCIVALVIFGIVALSSASLHMGQIKFGDNYYFLKHQALYGIIPGILGFFITTAVYYGKYQKIALSLILINIGLLLLIFSPLGVKFGGASRWLAIGPITFQPGELLHITLVIYLAAWLAGRHERQKNVAIGLLPLLVILGVIGGTLLVQSSTSMFAMLLATTIAMYFGSGAKIRYLIGIFVLGTIILGTVSAVTPYRLTRIKTFLNPDTNTQNAGYHVNQAKIAIGSGGLSGVGLGQSITKIKYLPEPIGDSIFAIIGEELGFVGSTLLVTIFMLFIIRTMTLSTRIHNEFGKLLLIGFGANIGLRAFVNIAAISGLIPLTGTPLPFISYGGTALASLLTVSGIMVNISTHATQK